MFTSWTPEDANGCEYAMTCVTPFGAALFVCLHPSSTPYATEWNPEADDYNEWTYVDDEG